MISISSSASAMSPIPKRTFTAFNIGNVDEAIALAVATKSDAIVYDPRFSGMTQADVDKIHATDTAYGGKMQAILWLAPNLDHKTEVWYELADPTIRAQRIQMIKNYLDVLNVDGVHYEELESRAGDNKQKKNAINAFLLETAWIREKGVQVSFNMPNMNTPQYMGIDRTYINQNNLVDYVVLQANEYSVADNAKTVDDWQAIMPNIPIMSVAYGWTSKTQKTCVANGYQEWKNPSCYSQIVFELIDYFNAQRGKPIYISQISEVNVAYYYPGHTLDYIVNPTDTVPTVIGRIPVKDYGTPITTPTNTVPPKPVPTGWNIITNGIINIPPTNPGSNNILTRLFSLIGIKM